MLRPIDVRSLKYYINRILKDIYYEITRTKDDFRRIYKFNESYNFLDSSIIKITFSEINSILNNITIIEGKLTAI